MRRRRGSPQGLSPRERGNRSATVGSVVVVRSIPARAGEPRRRAAPGWPRAVYPRASGGTVATRIRLAEREGLSPRERGNPDPSDLLPAGLRSIPARAGEPRPCGRGGRPQRVYPRASGGTTSPSVGVSSSNGLSPRERGNHHARLHDGPSARSIPARAGEPDGGCCGLCEGTVYPRASGGTPTDALTQTVAQGLSPRERGNQRPC